MMNHKPTSIALVGNPNCGKTAIFNQLTGAHQKVANYAGATIERIEGDFHTQDKTFHIIDLPGIYSLEPLSKDERVTHDILLKKDNSVNFELIVFVVDASNLNRSLSLINEIAQFKIPMVIGLNMMDLAHKRGIKIDVDKLSKTLKMPVVELVALKKNGITPLTDFLKSWSINQEGLVPPHLTDEQLHTLVEEVVTEHKKGPSKDEKIDHFVLHPIFGLPLLLCVLFFIFQAVFSWAQIPMEFIESGISLLTQTINQSLPDGLFKSLVTDGIIAGVGAVLVFLPQIIILFFFIIVLEELGYLPRAAFLLDNLMRRIGLSGHAFIPLLSGFACAVPAIMASRTIANTKDRLLTILIIPLMTCSARLPVYTLIIGAFFPKQNLWIFNLQGLVLFGLYLFGIISAILVSLTLKYVWKNDNYQPFLMELPSYHIPRIQNIAILLLARAKVFLLNVSTIIFATSILLWVLSSYPTAPVDAIKPAIEYSFAGQIGQFIEPLFRPIGFNWQIVVSLIPGMGAREIAISALGTVYALSTSEADLPNTLSMTLASAWSLPTALSLLVWFVFAPQCFATLSTIKRETNSWKMMFVALAYLFGLAYLSSWIAYQVSTYFLLV